MAASRSAPVVTLHRFFLDSAVIRGSPLQFPEDVSRQIRLVLRLRNGDHVEVFDGTGYDYEVVLTVASTTVTGAVVTQRRNAAEPQTALTLYTAIVKGAKFELLLQKCTEVGVARVVPTITARAVAREAGKERQRRFEAIVKEAAEQSGRGRLPVLTEPLSFGQALTQARSEGASVLLWERERIMSLAQVPLTPGKPTSLFVGPEGGFTVEEAAEAARAGVYCVTLGPRILRTETAAIVGSALILFQLDSGVDAPEQTS